MRTKIEYSVELKDVPREVKEKISEVSETLYGLSKYTYAIAEDLEGESLGPILRRVDNLRKKLFQVDNSLEDCMRALAGYGDTLTQIQQEQAAQQMAQQAPVIPPQEAGEDA
tara:strand:+ start:256 stop:591 length:336 start_codon:yes stop_codon:yes gene_type:complete